MSGRFLVCEVNLLAGNRASTKHKAGRELSRRRARHACGMALAPNGTARALLRSEANLSRIGTA
jgi:hypothetical protein